MKKLLLTIAALITMMTTMSAQTVTNSNEEIKSVFGNDKKIKLGWFIGIDPGYTQFSHKDAWLGGLSVGMIINHNFTIGLAGKAWCNRDYLYFENAGDSIGGYFEGGYGGLLLEYTLFPKSVIHLTFPVMIGAGGATYTSKEEFYVPDDHGKWEWKHKTIDNCAYFVVEPGVRAEMNVFRFMRVYAGVSYRYIPDLNLKNTPSDMMNNFNAAFGLKFGKF